MTARRVGWAAALAGAGVALPLALPLDAFPRGAGYDAYRTNALEMRAYLNNHPVAAVWSRLTTLRTALSAPKRDGGVCNDPFDETLPTLRNTRSTLTDYTLFAIPIRRYHVDCGGVYISRRAPA